MLLYLIIFAIPAIMFFASINGNGRDKASLAIYMAGLALFVGLSDMLGGFDRYIYGQVFDNIANITDLGTSYVVAGTLDAFPSERGWSELNIIVSFFTTNRYIFIFIVTIAIYSMLFVSIKRYAVNYPFALLVFLGLWFFFSFTYLRQVFAATFVWLSIPYIIKRKIWKYLVIALTAMTFHKSAIIFLPLYFVVNRNYSQRQIVYIMVATFIIGLSPIPNALFGAYGSVSQVEESHAYTAEAGFRIEYVIEAVLFCWLLMQEHDNDERNVTKRVILNIGFVYCLGLLFFMRSPNGGRLAWYYIIGVICGLSYFVSRYQLRQSLILILVVMFLFLYVRIFNAWQLAGELYPYKTFLTNGQRQWDPILKENEYDWKYEVNKFYRKPFRFKTNIPFMFEPNHNKDKDRGDNNQQ